MANWNSLIPSQFKPCSFISSLRTFLGGRNFKPNVRMVDEVSSPTQPPPDVPGGPNHTVFNNYYCVRDSRREVTHPEVIFENISGLIENSKKPDTEPGCPPKVPVPGKVFHWD